MPTKILPVDPASVDELEALYELVEKLRTKIEFDGLALKDESFAELRERIAAGRTTMEDGPPSWRVTA